MVAENRSLERMERPPGFPGGRLGAGELASLEERAAADGDYMKGAMYGLSPERKVEVASMAAHIGVSPSSEEAWRIPLALGHVSRVALRIPAETRADSELAAKRLSADLDSRASLLASLDEPSGQAGGMADRATEAARRAQASAEGLSLSAGGSAAGALSGLPELAGKAAEAAVASLFMATMVSIERRVQEAEVALGRGADDHARSLKVAAHNAGEQMGTRVLSVAGTMEERFKAAAKAAVAEASRARRRTDPWMAARIAAVAAVFVALCGMSAWLGWSAGADEGAAAAMSEARQPVAAVAAQAKGAVQGRAR